MLDENAHLKCVWWVLSLVWFYPHFPMVRVISIVSWQCCGSSHRAPKARMVDVRDLITRWFRNKRLTNKYNVGPPSHVSWCINPHNYSYLRTINHSEIGVICTNLAILGASHCRNSTRFDGGFIDFTGDWINSGFITSDFIMHDSQKPVWVVLKGLDHYSVHQ